MLVLKVISRLIRVKMNNLGNYDSLIAHLYDLKEKSERWHKSVCSAFLTDHALSAMMADMMMHVKRKSSFSMMRRMAFQILYA